MPALWTYPWTLYAEGLSETIGDLERRGMTALNVAAHYHSVRSLCPRTPDRLFESYPGGCYVPSDSERFGRTPLDPIPNRVSDVSDPLGGIVTEADDHGLSTNAWVVCFHNTRLATGNPRYRVESAFGDPHDHSVCPSHRAVHEYFGAVVDSVADRGVDEIQLESVGFPSAFHGHGREFGHDKRHSVTTPAGEALVSQCFCDGCRRWATDHPVDFDAARSRVRDLVRERLRSPGVGPDSLRTLVDEEPVLEDLFDFRRAVIEEFVAHLASASGDVRLNYYVMEWPGFDPGDGWPAGVHLGGLEAHLDRMTALCYVADPELARRRIRALRRTTSCPVDAGVTLDPSVVGGRDAFEDVVAAVREEEVGTCSVYHHSLLTETQLDWVRDAFATDPRAPS